MAHINQSHSLIGAHVSTAGGFYKAIERGASIGCNTIQLFTKSNRQWQARSISKEEVELFDQTRKKYGMDSIVAHASYLINIGSPDSNAAQKSVDALIVELERCELLGIPYLVLHPGSHLNTDVVACLERIANNLSYALSKVPGTTTILLETMAGQGSSTCATFQDIAFIINKTNPQSRIGVCIDICHIFVAGYDIRTLAGYTNMWKSFDTIIGRKYLKTIHMNDSKKECGSHVDRHAEIGKGIIGNEGFSLFMNDASLKDIPKIVETPIHTLQSALLDHKRNVDALKDLIKQDHNV